MQHVNDYVPELVRQTKQKNNTSDVFHPFCFCCGRGAKQLRGTHNILFNSSYTLLKSSNACITKYTKPIMSETFQEARLFQNAN